VRLSTDEERADIRNNIVYVTASGSRLGIVESAGRAVLRHNWLKTGWQKSHSNPNAAVIDSGGTIVEDLPGFSDFTTRDFSLLQSSRCVSGGTLLPEACYQNLVLKEYVKHQRSQERRQDAVPDIGAFEYAITALKNKPGMSHIGLKKALASPNPFLCKTTITFHPIGKSQTYTLRILDNAGRQVYAKNIRNSSSGTVQVLWDGRDINGKKLPAGSYVYFVSNKINNMVFKGRVVKVR
jgi:hypothetical protein